eukprot:NODE_18457_length_892_cov_4.158170.p1 GENE.NODE_18457_length_892_cov_4.158170~~NODE_18457_length_892_cov_4.158170.p1  ORF type:complete len:222 (-),score=60.92 NODE_18457_length_892_cov_4.158170:127-792(-)
MTKEEDFSLGVTALLDELLAKQDAAESRCVPADEACADASQPAAGDAFSRMLDTASNLGATPSRQADLSGTAPWFAGTRAGDDDECDLMCTLNQTANLCFDVGAFLGSMGDEGGCQRWEALAAQELRDGDEEGALSGTATLDSALRVNDERIALLRGEIAELRQKRGASGAGDGVPTAITALDAMASRCDALAATASRWHEVHEPPPGWQRIAGNTPSRPS